MYQSNLFQLGKGMNHEPRYAYWCTIGGREEISRSDLLSQRGDYHPKFLTTVMRQNSFPPEVSIEHLIAKQNPGNICKERTVFLNRGFIIQKVFKHTYPCYFSGEETKWSVMEQGPEDCTSLIPHMYWVLKIVYEPNVPTSTRLIVLFKPPTLHHFRIVVLNFPTPGLTHASRHAWRQSWWQNKNKKTLENWSATKPCTPTHIIQCLKPRKRSPWIDGISNYKAKMMWNRCSL